MLSFALGADLCMQTTNNLRHRKSVDLRSERDRLKARVSTLRVEWKVNVADRDGIARDGKACNANIDRINAELERRREWVKAQNRVQTHVAPVEPEFEPDYSQAPSEPTWDEQFLAVGTWS